MKFQADMKAFRAALAIIGKVIPTKSPIPVALCVRIVTNDTTIILTGTNFDTTVEFRMAADVLTEGETCVGFATLNAFCAASKADAIVFDVDKLTASLRAGKSRIALAAMDPRDFPTYLPAEGDPVTINPPVFARALKFCVSAAADEDVRYYLKGAAIIEGEGRLDFWGSDGHGLHHASVSDIPQIGGGGIVPTAAAELIVTMIEKLETARALVTRHGWHVIAGPMRAWGKMIDGTYPNVRGIIDGFKDWREFLIAPRAEVEASINIAACGSDTGAGGARSLIFRASAGGPVIVRGARGAAGVHHAGRAETMTPAKADALFQVSSHLISTALSAMDTQEVSLSYSDRDGTSAVTICPAQADAVLRMSALIMGMRASAEDLADV